MTEYTWEVMIGFVLRSISLVILLTMATLILAQVQEPPPGVGSGGSGAQGGTGGSGGSGGFQPIALGNGGSSLKNRIAPKIQCKILYKRLPGNCPRVTGLHA
jgi:hypothetical protein